MTFLIEITLVEVRVVNAIQKRSILEGRGTYPLNVQRLRFLCRAVAYRKVLFVFAKILCSVI